MKKAKQKIDFKETFKNLKRSWKYAKNQKTNLIFYIIVSIIMCGISVITPILSAKLIVNVTNGLFKDLIVIAIIIFLVEVSGNIISFLSHKINEIIYLETLLEIQIDIANETLKLRAKEIDKNNSGVFIDRLKQDAGNIADIFISFTSTLTDVFANSGILVAIFIINKWIFLYLVITITILFLLERKRMAYYYKINKEYRKINEQNTGLLTELIRGVRDIKVLNANKEFLHKIKESLFNSNSKTYEMNKVSRNYQLLIGSTKDLFNLLFIFLGVFLTGKNLLTITNFIILYYYQGQIQGFLGYFVNMTEWFKKFNVAAERVFELIGNDTFEKEQFGDVHLDKINGDFEFKNVDFSYNKNNKILKKLSFKIKANETVAFVGKSGGGKSTIFSLITKLYDVNSGEILIDGVNINDLDKSSIRNNISIITQNPYIFNFSIKDNLKIVKPNLTKKEMIEVCKAACLHDFVMTLPEKYDTIVGEGGIALSGGQRQRLAIARALLKKTEIILFDEATSALDNETQEQIQQAIHNMKGEYTILIIAHRLSTVINADWILLIDDGKVVDQGTHEYLIKNNKVYKDLYNKELT